MKTQTKEIKKGFKDELKIFHSSKTLKSIHRVDWIHEEELNALSKLLPTRDHANGVKDLLLK